MEVTAPCDSGTVCVQWAWDDAKINSISTSRRGRTDSRPVLGVDTGSDDHEGGIATGLYPTRTAFILLGRPLPTGDGEGPPGGVGGGGDVSCPSITVSRVLAVSADGLKRRASQLKVRQTFQDEA